MSDSSLRKFSVIIISNVSSVHFSLSSSDILITCKLHFCNCSIIFGYSGLFVVVFNLFSLLFGFLRNVMIYFLAQRFSPQLCSMYK